MCENAANLLYLTIYNPTLKPASNASPDDEDAEEQAHILFYTAKERAVSRDRMLRQIGLAKALISFSEILSVDGPCDNVHSQTKRLTMVQPEPNYWIHAGIEMARTPRPVKGKGKEKEKPKADTPTVFDYHDYSAYDVAVKADILRGYEKFKLKHGSFASILSSLGREALELQLERFFTVWAWSWDLDDGPEFGQLLGPSRHPLQISLSSIMDEFSSRLPDEVVPIAVSPPFIIPSTRYTDSSFPSALAAFILSLVPPIVPEPADPLPVLDVSMASSQPEPAQVRDAADENNKTFLGMNLDVRMDMPKWNWPGYLTFGKGGKKPPDLFAVTPRNEDKGDPLTFPLDTPRLEQTTDFDVDRSALEDAIQSEQLPLPLEKRFDDASISETIKPTLDDEDAAEQPGDVIDTISVPIDETANQFEEQTRPEPIEFSATSVYLASGQDPNDTVKKKLFYVVRSRVLVCLIGLEEAGDLAEDAAALAASLYTRLNDEPLTKSTDSVPSATVILQPKDRFVLTTSSLVIPSTDFQSRSGHLYNARQLLHGREPNITEIFSRGQNPQHWHVARHGLGTETGTVEEDVYLEVFRKETSLTDVDNTLAAVIRRNGNL